MRIMSSGAGLAAIGGVFVALALGGCASGHSAPETTVTRTVTPSPTASPTHVSASPTPTDTSAAAARCTTDHLAGAIGERDGAPAGTGSGMSQLHVAIILTNTGPAPCTLQGWPGISLVGRGNGTQLGAAAQLDRSTPHPTVTIAPGGRAQAPLDYREAGVYEASECQQVTADGLRVYPPGSTSALFIADKLDACTLKTHDLLTVGAFVAYP